MQFNIIKNRKGEKILSIKGYKNDEYGEEADDTVFVNLNKLLKDGNNHEDQIVYQTHNPYTRHLDNFKLKLDLE